MKNILAQKQSVVTIELEMFEDEGENHIGPAKKMAEGFGFKTKVSLSPNDFRSLFLTGYKDDLEDFVLSNHLNYWDSGIDHLICPNH